MDEGKQTTDRNRTSDSVEWKRRLTSLRRSTATGLLAMVALLALPAASLAATFASTDAPTAVHHTSAVLNGHFDPGSDPAVDDCYFDWGATTAYGSTIPCAEGTFFADPEDVTATLGGMTPGSTYHYRLHISTSASGDFTGTDRTVTPTDFPIGRLQVAAFGPDGTAGTTFSQLGNALQLAPLTVDAGLKRLYLYSPSGPGIYAFDISVPGSYSPISGFQPFATQSGGTEPGLAVDNTALPSAGNIYLASSASDEVYGFTSSRNPLGGNFPIDPAVNPGNLPTASSPPSVCGVAVDPSGHVWVGMGNLEVLLEYSSSGAFIRSIKTTFSKGGFTAQRSPCTLSFDSNADLYFATPGGYTYKSFSPDYDPLEALPIGKDLETGQVGFSGVSANPSSHNFFGAQTGLAREFASDGSVLRVFGNESGNVEFSGIASDPVSDQVYLADGTSRQIRGFGAPGPLTYPTVTTEAAGGITDVSARLRGAVDPEDQGPITECQFEWGTTGSYGSTAPCSALPGSGSGDVDVSAEITGLNPNSTYHFRVRAANAFGTSKGQDMTFTTASTAPPVKNLETLAATARTNTSARLRGSLNPNGAPLSGCHFDYGTTTAYGQSAPCSPDPGSGTEDVAVHADVSGLSPNTVYHFRLQATNGSGTSFGADRILTTRGPPSVETVGSPVRTATTARLDGRVDPERAPALFHFEYGSQGPCGSNPCVSTPPQEAGEGNQIELVAQQVSGLQPATTYHYRVVADNGNPDGPTYGADMTLTTWSSDEPLGHGPFPGPPGSDRAWEQVNAPDTSGNPVVAAQGVSDDGSRAVYQVAGGTPYSDSGSIFSQLFAERPAGQHPTTGWQTLAIHPPRSEQIGPTWEPPAADSDLSVLYGVNGGQEGAGTVLWKMIPGGGATKLITNGTPISVSADASRVLVTKGGSEDPAHPFTPTPGSGYLYDITSGTPRIASLLPDNSVPACGIASAPPYGPATQGPLSRRTYNWVSPDGSLAYFASQGDDCSGPLKIYVRDLQSGTTSLVSPPPLSGPNCDPAFLRSTPGAVFFWTQSRLSADDVAIAGACEGTFSLGSATGGDVYRYDLEAEDLECVTCVATVPADVGLGALEAGRLVGVAANGSRVYFSTRRQLLPGAPVDGKGAIYRVNVGSGDLALVAPGPARVGDSPGFDGTDLTPDGSVLVFVSSGQGLNQVGGTQNAGMEQYYRYDDRDRSLICVSCPLDGSAPQSAVSNNAVRGASFTPVEVSPNMTPLDAAGDFFFATATPLVAADQNTASGNESPVAGTDVYEWRDGRLLLISDGSTSSPSSVNAPAVAAVTPSGRDVFFLEAAQLTPDAVDSFPRLYDARVGGGIDFPVPPPPCSLAECQGPPSPTPVDPAGTSADGPGNQGRNLTPRKCKKGYRRKHGRCVKKHKHRRHHGKKRDQRTSKER